MKINKNKKENNNLKNIKPKIIIDTDPGHDDALALLMIIKANKFDIKAITTVAGNSTIKNVTRNAQAIVNLTHKSIPIFSGFQKPLERKLVTAVVHGESGLAGFDTSKTNFQLTANAPDKIIELVKQNPHQITILTLGPLSNIARAIIKDPTIVPLIKQIVMMGGAINVPGNTNRVAEFNFFVDPKAAEVIFQSNIPKVLVPLDVCNQTALNINDFRKIKNKNLNKILTPMMEHFSKGLAGDEGTSNILAYDALAAFFLFDQSAFKLKNMDIMIETKGKHTFGMTVAEKREHKIKKTNTKVAMKVDNNKFRENLFKYLNMR